MGKHGALIIPRLNMGSIDLPIDIDYVNSSLEQLVEKDWGYKRADNFPNLSAAIGRIAG